MNFIFLYPIYVLIWFSEQPVGRVRVAIVTFADGGKLGLKQYEGQADPGLSGKSQHYTWIEFNRIKFIELNGCFAILLAQT